MEPSLNVWSRVQGPPGLQDTGLTVSLTLPPLQESRWADDTGGPAGAKADAGAHICKRGSRLYQLGAQSSASQPVRAQSWHGVTRAQILPSLEMAAEADAGGCDE